MGVKEQHFKGGALCSLALLLLLMAGCLRHTRHSWFFRPDVPFLEVCSYTALMRGAPPLVDCTMATTASW